ncbi:MAG: hypothetical protein DRI48_11490, partial [Chloroflexi bacterium]
PYEEVVHWRGLLVAEVTLAAPMDDLLVGPFVQHLQPQAALRIPPEWLRAGVGVANLKDLQIGGQL